MFENWFWITFPLLAFVLIGLGLYSMGRYPRKKEQFKEETYTCGEPLPDIYIGSENFYQAIKRTLRLSRLRDLHAGDLSDYLLWVMTGLAAVLILVALA